ncbi:hypothetical protein ACFP2T_28435 [Plantactinospora solaniradicis]|uniref:Oxidoreductase n=1 Tax=Plantactinospora solaniradicis TaxID=1723736 RepID=A0ABW1KGP7_9ACTN
MTLGETATDPVATRGWSVVERSMWEAYHEGERFVPDPETSDTSVQGNRIRQMLLAGSEPRPGRQAALRLRGVTVAGELDLRDLDLSCVVDFDDCTFEGKPLLDGLSAPAIWLTGCRLPGLAADRISVARSLTITRSRIDGSCYLRDARIGAQLDLEATVVVPTGYLGKRPDLPSSARTPDHYVGIDAENITVGGDLDGERLTCYGALFLNLARIDGALILSEARLPDGFVQAPSLVAGGVYGRRMRLHGTMNLYNSQINGPVDLAGAQIENPGEISFGGWGMTVAGSFEAQADTVFAGTVDLQAADIRGAVQLSYVRCTDPGEHGSLYLPRAVVRSGVVARHARLAGPVSLQHAQVSAGVDLRAVEISAGPSAPGSLFADNIVVAGDLDLTSAALDGAVALAGARVDGTVTFLDSRVGCVDGCSVAADGLTAFQLVFEGHPPTGGVDLSHATVHVLCDTPGAWSVRTGRLLLTHFTYQQLRKDAPVARRLDILRRATPTVEPQPYEQLAAAYRSAGRERDARRVLREKLRRESHAGGWPRRLWGLVQDLTVGYGYLPGRAAAIFGSALLAGTAYFAVLGDCAGRRGLCPVKTDEHPTWDPFLYALDLLIPVVDLGHERAWDPVGADKVVMVVLMLIGWVFASTIVAAAGRALSRS